MNIETVRKNVDIIIPVYNAYEDLNLCINSILKNTDLLTHRVIIVNDNSPDPRIKAYLDGLNINGIKIIHNEVNKGFSANINIGMEQSEKNDVILLNSDTIVTQNWVEKLVKCAYSNKLIGTVTPVSNNATLCSVPNFCEENTLPEYLDIETAGRVVEHCSFKEYPRITVAHGFCMYVKREVIKSIGGFDAQTFQRGYGEENDFCNRAEQMGYIHVMCDDTYIYHSGTKSFVSKEKEQYIREHDKILHERYPKQMRNNEIFCAKNPNGYIGRNVEIYFKINNGKKNVLYVLHSDFRVGKNDSIGGTQFHVRDLKNGLTSEYNVYVVARNGEFLTLTIYIDEEEYLLDFWIGSESHFILENDRRIQKVLDNILEAFKIQLIHVHHIIGLSFDIFNLAKEKEIPIFLTAHDYYYVCPTIKMLDVKGNMCCKEKGEESCKNCLRSIVGTINSVDYLARWQDNTRKVFDICSGIIFPSESDRAIYAMHYPEFIDKYKVIEHGVELNQERNYDFKEKIQNREEFIFGIEHIKSRETEVWVDGWINAFQIDRENERLLLRVKSKDKEYFVPLTLSLIDYTRGIVARFTACLSAKICEEKEVQLSIVITDDLNIYCAQTEPVIKSFDCDIVKRKMNIAFIGGLDVSKGSSVVYDIIKKGSKDIQWYTFGTIGDEKLKNLNQKNYTAFGTYNQKDLKHLINLFDIDVIGILSIWPETYSYTLSEALVNQVPVIVTDIGALGERTNKLNAGWSVSVPNAANEFVNISEKLLNSEVELNKMKKNVQSITLKSIKEMVTEYSMLYNGVDVSQIKYTDQYDRWAIYDAFYSENNKEREKQDNVANINGNNSHYAQEAEELRILKSTLTYQLMIKIINLRMPFKKNIMDIVYKIWKNNK